VELYFDNFPTCCTLSPPPVGRLADGKFFAEERNNIIDG
jgi:hypothetical protein